MSATTTDPDAYYRIYKALHLVTHEAIPCVDNCLKIWHTNLQLSLPACTGNCPDSGKKRKKPTSCKKCVAWGGAVEAALYPRVIPPVKPQMTWQNVDQSNLGQSYVEVAKAFVLRLPHKQGVPSQQYTSIAHFDSASLLMLMSRFSEFHQGDQASFDIIMKVAGIRNELSHMALENDMHLNDQLVKRYFQDIDAFISCLEALHPKQFSAHDVRNRCKEIQMEPVTTMMKKYMNHQIQQDLESVCQENKRVGEEVADLKVFVSKHVQENAPSFDLPQCQSQLKADYKTKRSTIGLTPGMPKDYPIEEFFVDLSLVRKEKRPTEVICTDLTKYTDLLILKDKKEHQLKHVLVSAEAAMGKTSMINKLAHEWATLPQYERNNNDKPQHPLSKFELVFILDVNKIKKDMDLVDAIQDQLLSLMSKPAIEAMITANGDKCLYLFDDYDELKSQLVLSSKYLNRSHVIVTLRPDKIDEFCSQYKGYTHVTIIGFTRKGRETFIDRYLYQDADNSENEDKTKRNFNIWLENINDPCLKQLSLHPLFLATMCSLVNERNELSLKVTTLHSQTIHGFALHLKGKTNTGELLTYSQNDELDELILALGLPALKGLLIEDRKFKFDKTDFDTTKRIQFGSSDVWVAFLSGIVCACIGLEVGLRLQSLILGLILAVFGFTLGFILLSIKINHIANVTNRAVKLGLLTKINDSRKESCTNDKFVFVHKTVQDFSAAKYWSSLVSSDRARFKYYLNYINTSNVKSMQYLLRFCCGCSKEVASAIVQYVHTNCDVDLALQQALLFESESESESESDSL